MFGALIGWLRIHLGLKTDTASATGSLHAKTAYIAGNIRDVKSIQRGVTSITNDSTSDVTTTVNISAVDMGKSLVIINWASRFEGNGNSDDMVLKAGVRVSLASTTSLSVFLPAGPSVGVKCTTYVAWQVIEFY
jgi:hypothetical protein